MSYKESVEKLLEGIKEDYAGWGSPQNLEDSQKEIRLRMTKEFNNGLYVKSGKKYDKVITGTSVWGFIAKEDGLLKGIPHKKGDVFKAAGWRARAKWARGSIFSGKKFYAWTGPNYLI